MKTILTTERSLAQSRQLSKLSPELAGIREIICVGGGKKPDKKPQWLPGSLTALSVTVDEALFLIESRLRNATGVFQFDA